MTNEQLALYLRSLAGNLISLADDVGKLITEGERGIVPVWTGEGEPEFEVPDFRVYYKLPEGWEHRPEGDFKAVSLVRNFAQHLYAEADQLTRGQK